MPVIAITPNDPASQSPAVDRAMEDAAECLQYAADAIDALLNDRLRTLLRDHPKALSDVERALQGCADDLRWVAENEAEKAAANYADDRAARYADHRRARA
jgi:hypothetical protein